VTLRHHHWLRPSHEIRSVRKSARCRSRGGRYRSDCSGAGAPLPPPAAWNSWMSASRGPDRLDDRRVWRAAVLQTCHHSALICGNFYRNPDPGAYRA